MMPISALRPAALLVLASLLSLAGCSFAPRVQAPEAVTALPEAYAALDTLAAYAPETWWSAYNDPVLDAVLDSVRASNLDLAEAVARVEEVAALYRIQRSGLFPTLEASANVSRQDQPIDAGFGGVPIPGLGGDGDAPDRFDFTQYTTGLALAYEIDFWGRVRNDTKAAVRDVVAAEADLRTAELTVLAQSITTYFDIVDLRTRIALTVETIDVLAERVERTQERYDRGLVTSFELYSVLQTFRNAQSGLPLLEGTLANAEGRLAVLMGRYAGTIDAVLGDTLAPQLALTPIPAGLPSELLVQRPDVLAALQRMEAARLRVGARRAELFPRLTLSGSIGTQSNDVENALNFDRWVLSLASGLAAPIFQGGRLRANVSAAEARYAQTAAAYARAVLTAYQEVDGALQVFEEGRQRYLFLDEQRAEAQATADLQASRFER
ncbi:MAG: TolC family protein, partial [Bacteroidota bacterium]